MTVIIDYATISPAVLATLVERKVPNAVCVFYDNIDTFEFWVCGWLPLTPQELSEVERVLAPYV